MMSMTARPSLLAAVSFVLSSSMEAQVGDESFALSLLQTHAALLPESVHVGSEIDRSGVRAFVEVNESSSLYEWGLPGIMSRNVLEDPELVNCVKAVPDALCRAGRKELDPISKALDAPWAAELEQRFEGLHQDTADLPLERFVPYCHHHDNCQNPSWRIMPLMVLHRRVPSNLDLAPSAASTLDWMVERIPGLITVVLSMSIGKGHITPHCGSAEGFQFTRYHLGVRIPTPAAHIRLCDHEYEMVEGSLLAFNNSHPHEIINPSEDPRYVLLFDVLLPQITDNETALATTMDHLKAQWGDQLRDMDKVNNGPASEYNGIIHHVQKYAEDGAKKEMERLAAREASEREAAGAHRDLSLLASSHHEEESREERESRREEEKAVMSIFFSTMS